MTDKEKLDSEFKTKVNNIDKRAFATFIANKRKAANIKEGSYIILRAVKNKRKFEFITKISKWGKFHIPKKTFCIFDIEIYPF